MGAWNFVSRRLSPELGDRAQLDHIARDCEREPRERQHHGARPRATRPHLRRARPDRPTHHATGVSDGRSTPWLTPVRRCVTPTVRGRRRGARCRRAGREGVVERRVRDEEAVEDRRRRTSRSTSSGSTPARISPPVDRPLAPPRRCALASRATILRVLDVELRHARAIGDQHRHRPAERRVATAGGSARRRSTGGRPRCSRCQAAPRRRRRARAHAPRRRARACRGTAGRSWPCRRRRAPPRLRR